MSLVYRLVAFTLFPLIYFVGLIGNGLIIFVVLRHKNLRTVANLLVVNVALGDFLFVFFCVPFSMIAYSFEYYPFSTIYCRFENFIINLSLGISVFSLLALSFDRYKIIVQPFSNYIHDPSRKIKVVVVTIWLLSILFAIPETIFSGLISETTNGTTYAFCWSPNDISLLTNKYFMISRQVIRLLVYYLLPLVFISIFYILIAKSLFQSSTAKTHRESNRTDAGRLNVKSNCRTPSRFRSRHKLAKTALGLCLIFFICWLPKQIHDIYWFVGVLLYSMPWNYFWQINKTFGLILLHIYSCINPFLLYFLSSSFRRCYRKYLFFCRKRRSQSNNLQ